LQKRDEIFTPFVSTKQEGTGLGLAISRKIVKAHKGDIKILDNPEGGVTFRVSFPSLTDDQSSEQYEAA
jgi:two-component system sensor histidine kinase AtoS